MKTSVFRLIGIVFLAILANWMIGFLGLIAWQSGTLTSSFPFVNLLSADDGDEFKSLPHSYWAHRIVEDGGFILYVRHAERNQFDQVTLFDYIEVENKIDGKKEPWAEAVCLNDRGRMEAAIVGEILVELEIRVSHVASSPSCRSRETAELAFGRIDEILLSAIHSTAVAESQRDNFSQTLKKELSGIGYSLESGTNAVVVGHAFTLDTYAEELFESSSLPSFDFNPLGIVVLEFEDGALHARHLFPDFRSFANEILEYSGPQNK